MKYLHIDIETYSDRDLSRTGVHPYTESPEFAVLLLCFAEDDNPVEVVDLACGERLSPALRRALTDPGVRKVAHNANFERVCLSRHLGERLGADQWECTMTGCLRRGYPASLKDAAGAIGLEERKMKEGAALIGKFSRPDRNGRRILPSDDPEGWETFRTYCKRDVETERAIHRWLLRAPAPAPFDEKLRMIDAEINDRGVAVDVRFARAAAAMAEMTSGLLLSELKKLTGLANPNSGAQLAGWLGEKLGKKIGSVAKGELEKILDSCGDEEVRKAILIRQELAKTSLAKYTATLDKVSADGRLRDVAQFHGTRTGRWSGRGVQLQNLPQNHMERLDEARELVKAGDMEGLRSRFPGMPVRKILSELVRTMFTASPGYVLQVCDFSAIEARVIAWLAGEDWVLDVFRGGGDIYCSTASKMFGVKVEKHGENAELRQKGKIAVLALGYGGGVNALRAMGGDRLGLSESEMTDIVSRWRDNNPRIVRMWRGLNERCLSAVENPGETCYWSGKLAIKCDRELNALCVTLPSRRVMYYPEPRIGYEGGGGRFTGDGRPCLVYSGVNQATRKWEEVRTYGGKITENVVQAIARDILGEVMVRCHNYDIRPVFHVHDELVCEVPMSTPTDRLTHLFSTPPVWAAGLPLSGAGYETQYYIKD